MSLVANCDASTSWKKVLDEKDPTNWVILGFENGGEGKVAEVRSMGTGGHSEFVKNIEKEKEVLYGGFVVYGVDKRGSVTSRRAKYVFVSWVGNNVKIMRRARVSSQKAQFKKWFTPSHMDFQVSDVDLLSKDEIKRKMLLVGGAHKPKSYDFGDDSSITSGHDDSSSLNAYSTPSSVLAETQKKHEDAARRESVARVSLEADIEQASRVIEHEEAQEENEKVRKEREEQAKKEVDAEQQRRIKEDEELKKKEEAEREENIQKVKELVEEEQYQQIMEKASVEEESEKQRAHGQERAEIMIKEEQERREKDVEGETDKKERARKLSIGVKEEMNAKGIAEAE